MRPALAERAGRTGTRPERSWGLVEGDEIVPGRHAVRLLGGGHRYEAYLAWDDDVHALVAVKLLRPDRTDDPIAVAGLEGEARALARLSHPFIVRSFGAVLDGPRPHLVLEYLDGPRLSTLVRTSVIAVEQVLSLALQLCSALHYLGVRRMLHLDLKPRNVIMASQPRLIDLSVARPVDERVSELIGTDAYMAPEQCDPRRFSEIGPPADVWGLGVTLYETLARSLPFGDDAGGRFPQLEQPPAPLPRHVPAPLAELVSSMLSQRPEDRPVPAELVTALQPLVAALPRPRLGRFRP